jgi:hypothetical protein
MSPRRFKIDQSRPFALAIYGPGGSMDLIWKAACAAPSTVPARGERIQPMEAKGARPDIFHAITKIEQVVWAGGDMGCSLTPVFTRPA